MGQALYRKYRTKSFGETIGQEHITETLGKALQSDRISHAYLFTGPRGVGKTSIARILAHEINGLPYDDDQTHIDIIEIDAASNRRIDEIRDLRDKVNIAPATAKYKVYIIDEVHMLTKEAFNALLKTLEEPPAHVVFILATTEAHKLPATIISRTQRFVFRPIATEQAVKHLAHIAQQEGITIDTAALELLARHGEGSFRDSISLLDQAANSGAAITADSVRDMLGIPSDEATKDLVQSLEASAAPQALLRQLATQYTAGIQPAAVAESLAGFIRQRIIDSTIDTGWATQLLGKLLEVTLASNPERYLEIILLSQLAPQTPAATPKPVTKPTLAAVEPAPTTAPAAIAPAKVETIEKVEPVKPKQPTSKRPPTAAITDESAEAQWPEVLARLKSDHNTLYGIVRMAKPDFDAADDTLHLTFAFAFHEKRIREAKNQAAISAAIEAVYGRPLTITCTVDPDLKLASKPQPATGTLPVAPAATEPDSSLSTISNIFGTAEVLE